MPVSLRQAENWPAPTTLDELEAALFRCRLYYFPNNVRGYACRRNGQTRRWKRDPARFSISLKYAFREHVRVDGPADFAPFAIQPDGEPWY